MNTNRQSGFTMTELAVTLAIAAILIAASAPTFRSVIYNNRIANHANNLVTTLNFARSEALKRGTTVTVSANNGTNWEDGWTVTAGGTTLRQENALDGTTTLAGNTGSVQFSSQGFRATSGNFNIDVCDSRQNEEGTRVSVNAAGKAATDGYTCP